MGNRPRPSSLAIADQILAVLRDGLPRTAKEIAAALGTVPCAHAWDGPCYACQNTGMRPVIYSDVYRHLARLRRDETITSQNLGDRAQVIWSRPPDTLSDEAVLSGLDWEPTP